MEKKMKIRIVKNIDIPKWVALSHEYDCYVLELVPDLSEWYDGNDTSISYGDYMDAKIAKQEAYMVVDTADSCLGTIAISKKYNRITFFAVSHIADFQTTGHELLKHALNNLDDSKPVSINQITSTSPHIQKHRDLFQEFGFTYSCDSVENGVPVNTFIKLPLVIDGNDISDNGFWQVLDTLIADTKIIIDRSKGSTHPRYPSFIYPLDYGYLKGTSAMDGSGIDVWRGSDSDNKLDAIMCIVDLMKRDSEIKLLIGCTEEEKAQVYQVHNATEFMKGILIKRDYSTSGQVDPKYTEIAKRSE
jgi:inorganic pyrophosphatase